MSNSAFFRFVNLTFFLLSQKPIFFFYPPVTNKHDKHTLHVYIIVMTVGKACVVCFVLLGIFIQLYSIDMYQFCFGDFRHDFFHFFFKLLFSVLYLISAKFRNMENSGLYFTAKNAYCSSTFILGESERAGKEGGGPLKNYDCPGLALAQFLRSFIV